MLPVNTAAQSAAGLLAEWEQRTGSARTPTHHPNRLRLLALLTDFWRITDEPADINVDIDDLRTALYYSSHQLGCAGASGSSRALRMAQAALTDAQTSLLGPTPTTPCVHILQVIESRPTAELGMDELTAITEHIQETVGNSQAEVVFGYSLQPNLPTELRLHLLLSYGPLLTPPRKPLPLPTLRLRPEEILPAALHLITERQAVSGSLLQRYLGLGCNRTCKLLEELAGAGIIRRREGSGGYEVAKADSPNGIPFPLL